MTKAHPYAAHDYVKKVQGKIASSWNYKELLKALKANGWERNVDVSTISKWVSGAWLWPEDVVPHLAAVLKLPEFSTPDAIERVGPYWSTVPNPRRRTKRSTASQPANFEDILARIDKERKRASGQLPEAMRQTVPLFAAMRNQHYFFATTFTEMPLIFQPVAANQEFIEAHYVAIQNGGIFCILVPDQQLSARTITEYALSGAATFSKFHRGFETFRSGVISFLKKLKPPAMNAEEYTDTHLQLLTYSELPLTPICWTVSLLGGRGEGGQREIQDRILIRAPEDLENAVRLFHHMDRYGRWMKHFALKVMQSKLDDLACSNVAHKKETLRIYLTNFRDRLIGDPDSEPTVLKIGKSSQAHNK